MKQRRRKERGGTTTREAPPVAARARSESAEDAPDAWYVAEGKRGQQLLDHGRLREATSVFEDVLARLGDAPSYGRAVILGRLGRCRYMAGHFDLAQSHARDAIVVVGHLAPTEGTKSLRGTLRSDLGDALRASGEHGEAKEAYEAALKIADEQHDLHAQAVDRGRLGALALDEGRTGDAIAHQQAVRLLCQTLDAPAMEAAAWHQLARAYHKQEQPDEAERHYREASRINEVRGDLVAAAHSWRELAALLQHQPGRLADARQLAEDALAVAQRADPVSADAWKNYGLLAEIADKERLIADAPGRAALDIRARTYRDVQRHGPAIVATLTRLGPTAIYGRMVILRQLARCFYMGRRPDLAIGLVREAVATARTIPPGTSDDLNGFIASLHLDLGDMLGAIGHDADARQAREAALTIAEAMHDLQGHADACERLGRVCVFERTRDEASPLEIGVDDEVTSEYVFDTDLLIDGPRIRRRVCWTGDADATTESLSPALTPRTRTWMDDKGAVRFSVPPGEPIVDRHPGCTVMRRIRREVSVAANPAVIWRLIAGMDGSTTIAGILSKLPDSDREAGRRVLAALIATGVVDVSGRPLGRFLHSATKKGVLPAGGLEGDAVLRLATDGDYRSYPGATRIPVSDSVPPRLHAFHALTRSRRSRRDYGGLALDRSTFDALLHTACGVTGATGWAGREVRLRAYPSSGALYAVEIYPIVFRVAGLDQAVYHYRPVNNALDVVMPCIDPERIAGAALPVEREMVAGAAALVCLAGSFPRHERKYGEGGYRMLVAEAGHISQNLILAATALGVSARPFGGVFDGLMNDDLGLDGVDEQFLLAVLVGYCGDQRP
jgi:SagB-type dehydrogenase family enzyme